MKLDAIIERKLSRLADGGQPRVIDLFSGCGGLSLGFDLAGCQIIAGVEMDSHAARSHALNFHGSLSPEEIERHAQPRDITKMEPESLLQELGFQHPVESVDILVGGPPCPAFARVGRAKLREVNEHPEAFRRDPRAQLYLPYLKYVKQLKPIAVLMENVPDILNFGGHNLGEEICEVLEEYGYNCSYSLLNSANYGVPQMRERFFLVGVHRDVGVQFDFPRPTRNVDFPPGYEGSRQVALRHVAQNDLFNVNDFHYVDILDPDVNAEGPVTVQQAIGDLPIITGHLTGAMKRGARRFDEAVKYRADVIPSHYAMQMRAWPGFEGAGEIWDHAIRSLSDRDYRLFSQMQPGDDYPKAFRLANKLLALEILKLEKKGIQLDESSPEYDKLKRSYVPPYDPGKFPNKWRKMEADQPARTLMAHLGKDSYSHIHYDSDQARVLSVREAARLQSFPDGFVFSGTMNPAFRQIGNAVPPLMAYALAVPLLNTIYTGATLYPSELPIVWMLAE